MDNSSKEAIIEDIVKSIVRGVISPMLLNDIILVVKYSKYIEQINVLIMHELTDTIPMLQVIQLIHSKYRNDITECINILKDLGMTPTKILNILLLMGDFPKQIGNGDTIN